MNGFLQKQLFRCTLLLHNIIKLLDKKITWQSLLTNQNKWFDFVDKTSFLWKKKHSYLVHPSHKHQSEIILSLQDSSSVSNHLRPASTQAFEYMKAVWSMLLITLPKTHQWWIPLYPIIQCRKSRMHMITIAPSHPIGPVPCAIYQTNSISGWERNTPRRIPQLRTSLAQLSSTIHLIGLLQ